MSRTSVSVQLLWRFNRGAICLAVGLHNTDTPHAASEISKAKAQTYRPAKQEHEQSHGAILGITRLLGWNLLLPSSSLSLASNYCWFWFLLSQSYCVERIHFFFPWPGASPLSTIGPGITADGYQPFLCAIDFDSFYLHDLGRLPLFHWEAICHSFLYSHSEHWHCIPPQLSYMHWRHISSAIMRRQRSSYV